MSSVLNVSEAPGSPFSQQRLRIVWLALLLVILLAGIVHALLPYGVPVAGVNVLVSLLSAAAVLLASRIREDLYQARGWLLIGLAGLSSFVGHLLWYVTDLAAADISPLVPYFFYLLTYGLLVAGLWLFGRCVETGEGSLVDSLMVVVAAAVLFWAVMIEPYLGTADRLGLVIASAYPVADLLLLMFTLKLFFLGARRSTALLMLIASTAILLTADLIHAYGVSSGWYVRGGPLDLLWYGVYALMAAAAWHPSANQALTDRPLATQQAFVRLLVIGVVSISVPAMILLTADSNHELVRVGALASIALFLLMLFRMTFLLRTNHKQAKALEHLIHTDPLTGAANRRLLEERLALEMARARRTGSPLTVGYLDLDYFKKYNDRHGHSAGDDLLSTAVARWQEQLRDTDLLARTGGEEFVVVCPDTPLEAGIEVLQRLQSVLPRKQTCSAGVTVFRNEDCYDSLLHRADSGLYRAKEQGRDRIVVGRDDSEQPAAPSPQASGATPVPSAGQAGTMAGR